MGIKWQTKFKKQPCKKYEGEELAKLAESLGYKVDLEKIEQDKAKKKADKEAAKKTKEESETTDNKQE